MPFWKRSKAEFEPESLRLQSDQVEVIAAQAVDGFLNTLVAEGYDLAEIQGIEGGRAFDRALAVLMNVGAMNYYSNRAQQLLDAGIMKPSCYRVLAQNTNEVNSLILRKLAALGFDVKRVH